MYIYTHIVNHKYIHLQMNIVIDKHIHNLFKLKKKYIKKG